MLCLLYHGPENIVASPMNDSHAWVSLHIVVSVIMHSIHAFAAKTNMLKLKAKVASKACAARVRQREQEMMKTRIRNMKPQAVPVWTSQKKCSSS